MAEIIKQLRSLSPQEQVKAIVKNTDAMALVRSLPAEELLLTVKQVGINDSLELIELLSPEQVQLIFDLDVWHHEVIDDAELNLWLAALEAANPETALVQMSNADVEFMTMMLRSCAVIHDLIENDDPNIESDLVLVTPDRHYAIAFLTDEDHEVQSRFLKRYLEDLMGSDFMSAIRLIESARFETDSLLHEDALRLRDGRLQDLGFLPFAEALSILSYVDVDRAKSNSHIPPAKNETEKALRWHYKLPSLNGLPFLREALLGLSHTVLEDSWNYIVTVANRVHMAQHGRYSDAEAVNETARYTLNFIEMALSYLSEGEIAKAKSAFLAHAPQDLFKIGHSLVLRLRRDFQKLSQHPSFALAQTSIARFDAPLREVVGGIMQVEPLFFTGLTDPKRVEFRPFENVREVAQTSAAVAEAAFRCAFLGEKGLRFSESEGPKASFGVLLATYFAHVIVGEPPSFEALNAQAFQRLFERLERTQSGRRISQVDKERCVLLAKEKASSLVGLVGVRTEQDAYSRATNYAQIVLGQIEAELSTIKDATPDLKYVSSVLVKVN
jgi:hypothetical protein